MKKDKKEINEIKEARKLTIEILNLIIDGNYTGNISLAVLNEIIVRTLIITEQTKKSALVKLELLHDMNKKFIQDSKEIK